ncbi:3-hydroxyisobutyryl-CoA hydrolase 1-like isoform X3 [Primulina huaijiensis]|uniref:3-hydroxyisobutyryl-CoA hydrolase 1-like isoform X3 n=1 Tax=Primulina huaijiensis TaxID=1492673 RepID=UPI003CC6F9DA
MASISSTNGETDQVSRLLELFIACWEDFAVKLLILKSYLHIWAPWIWCFLLPMLVPEARGTSLGFLLVCWQMLAFMIFYGQGRAFCAGGDVAAVVRDITLGNWRSGASSFRKEFTLNYVMATYYSKPQLFAMPETALGLFPDVVGSSYYLSRLPGFFENKGKYGRFLKSLF